MQNCTSTKFRVISVSIFVIMKYSALLLHNITFKYEYTDLRDCNFVFSHFCIFTKTQKYKTAETQNYEIAADFGSYFRNIDNHVVGVWYY